jgi:hypothetical protein
MAQFAVYGFFFIGYPLISQGKKAFHVFWHTDFYQLYFCFILIKFDQVMH